MQQQYSYFSICTPPNKQNQFQIFLGTSIKFALSVQKLPGHKRQLVFDIGLLYLLHWLQCSCGDDNFDQFLDRALVMHLPQNLYLLYTFFLHMVSPVKTNSFPKLVNFILQGYFLVRFYECLLVILDQKVFITRFVILQFIQCNISTRQFGKNGFVFQSNCHCFIFSVVF